MTYDKNIDVSALVDTSDSFQHNVIMITSRGLIYRRGIARNFQFIELSIVTKPPDPNCVIKSITRNK
jgi:hypothetical protein